MSDENKILGADAAEGDGSMATSASTVASHAELIVERDRYRRALENHLCEHDMADWMGCHFNHVELCTICQHDNGTDHTWLVRLERADRASAKLRAVITEWRHTADIWERHARYEAVSADEKRGHDEPPQRGMCAIRNWINWLRNKATEVEVILDATEDTASTGTCGSLRSAAPKDTIES